MKTFKIFLSCIIFLIIVSLLCQCFSLRSYADDINYSYLYVPSEKYSVKIESRYGWLYYTNENSNVCSYQGTVQVERDNVVANYECYCFDFRNIDWTRAGTESNYETWITWSFVMSFDGIDDESMLFEVDHLDIDIGLQIPGYNNVSLQETLFLGYPDPLTGEDIQGIAEWTKYSSKGTSDDLIYNVNMYHLSGVNQIASSYPYVRVMGLKNISLDGSFKGTPQTKLFYIYFRSDSSVSARYVDINAKTAEDLRDFKDDAEAVEQKLDIASPDISNISSSLEDDFVVLAPSASFFELPSNNPLTSFIISAGVSSLSLCVLGYILFGKKG